jgi:hypothetical protein
MSDEFRNHPAGRTDADHAEERLPIRTRLLVDVIYRHHQSHRGAAGCAARGRPVICLAVVNPSNGGVMRNSIVVGSATALLLSAVSCTSQPKPPKPGTPAFNWAAANETYRTGDFQKASDNLRDLCLADNEFAARARPLSIALSIGLAEGYAELANNFEAGARANRANPAPFRKQVAVFRSMASDAAIRSAEVLHVFLEREKDPNVPFAFAFPSGSATPPAALKRVASGILIQDAERESLQRAMLQCKVLLSVCRATGNKEDAAKALEMFKAGEVRVPRDVFLLSVATGLHQLTDLFTAAKLDQPNRTQMLCAEASEAIKAIPASKETKQLSTKIAATMKKAKPPK